MVIIGYDSSPERNGNVYNSLFSFLEDAKRKSNGT
jgi:hypothetical protein